MNSLIVRPSSRITSCTCPAISGGREKVMVSVSCASSDDSEIFEFAVGPELRDCVGIVPMRCMAVNGELFYDAIEGFDYVEGFDYLLKVERYDAWPDQEEPPQDASRYGYRLIEVISKTRRM